MAAPYKSPWWLPHVYAERRKFLLGRARAAAGLRAYFAEQDFLEVEAAALQVSPGNETHLHAFATELIGPAGERAPLYLHTSPEFACKKLLVAGERRIFDFAQVFRNCERGPLHHPAFTMLEWYRVGEPYDALMEDCDAILRIAARAVGSESLRFRNRACDPFAPPERLTVAEAFDQFAGIDLLATMQGPEPDRERLCDAARAARIRVALDDTWGDIFSKIMVESVEPNLGRGRPTILCEYPASQAALARLKPGDPRVAERFELYACGVELANGFGELIDPVEQRRRFVTAMAEKKRIHGETYPIDEDFLAALPLMLPTSGAALGFDRLIMLATGAEHIEQVIWTPVIEPEA
jgi:lysyl-tRNA synthetase class 2